MELRELELKLKSASVSKARADQIAENEAMRLETKVCAFYLPFICHKAKICSGSAEKMQLQLLLDHSTSSYAMVALRARDVLIDFKYTKILAASGVC